MYSTAWRSPGVPETRSHWAMEATWRIKDSADTWPTTPVSVPPRDIPLPP